MFEGCEGQILTRHEFMG